MRGRLLQVIAELDMVSQVSAASLEPSPPSSEAKGGRMPGGGIDRRGDREDSFRQKSAEHFRRRMTGCKTDRDYALVLADAVLALEAWRRTPASGSEPEYGTVQWKRWIAASPESGAELARRFNVTKQYISRVRRDWA